jgi:hypothetical protein
MLSFFKHFPAKRHVPGVLHVLHGLKPPPLFLDPLFLDPYAISYDLADLVPLHFHRFLDRRSGLFGLLAAFGLLFI